MRNADKLMMLYEILVRYKRTHNGNPPTIREAAAAMGPNCSTSTIVYYYTQLRELGLITFDKGEFAGMRIPGGEWVYKRPKELDALDPRQLRLL